MPEISEEQQRLYKRMERFFEQYDEGSRRIRASLNSRRKAMEKMDELDRNHIERLKEEIGAGIRERSRILRDYEERKEKRLQEAESPNQSSTLEEVTETQILIEG